MKSPHYELKQIYHGLLQKDPDYPAWQDFEWMDTFSKQWERMLQQPLWDEKHEYRYNPLPKKWEPKKGWVTASINVSPQTDHRDLEKLQAYATKLSWLREQGGYKFREGVSENYSIYTVNGELRLNTEDDSYTDTIYMNKEQAEKWLDMLNKGEV